jgi:hypothetical protein
MVKNDADVRASGLVPGSARRDLDVSLMAFADGLAWLPVASALRDWVDPLAGGEVVGLVLVAEVVGPTGSETFPDASDATPWFLRVWPTGLLAGLLVFQVGVLLTRRTDLLGR